MKGGEAVDYRKLAELGIKAEAGELVEDDGYEYRFQEPIVKTPKIGRNAPCPCGSGKKNKKCCGKN